MARATMSQLMAAVKEALPKIAANQARALIKANNTTSTDKITEVAAAYKGKTKEDLATEFGAADDSEFPAVAGKTAKKAAGKKVARKGTESRRRVAATVEAGPRGFRFGETWNQSVKDGTAPALAPANLNKLYAHADSLGVAYDKRSDDAAAIAKKVARKL